MGFEFKRKTLPIKRKLALGVFPSFLKNNSFDSPQARFRMNSKKAQLEIFPRLGIPLEHFSKLECI